MAGYKVFAFTQEMFCGKFRGRNPGYEITKDPLPKDAKVVSMTINPANSELEFVIYSDSYEWRKPGMPIPYGPVPMYKPWMEE